MDPIALFLERRAAAVDAGALFDGTKAVLATATSDGVPSARYVLVKEVGEDGFFVYTNYESRKARELDANPRASICVHWAEIDELGLGALRVRSVPHVVRSLEPLSAALGRPIGMVIGADLLLRLAAVIDGPAGRVRVHASPPPSTEGTGAGLLPLSGSFLAVEAQLDGAPAWLTLDTAGLFPLALTPSASDALEGWRETDGVELVLLDVRIGALEVRELPAIRGLLDDGHARAIGAPVSGSLGWGLLGQLVIAFDPRARRIRFDGSHFEESGADP